MHRSFITICDVILSATRSVYLTSDASSLTLAIKFAGTTISAGTVVSTTLTVSSLVTILRSSSSLISLSSLLTGVYIRPFLYAVRSWFASMPCEVRSISSLSALRPLPNNAFFRPVSDPFAWRSDAPVTILKLSIFTSLFVKFNSNPRRKFLRGKCGVMTTPVLTPILPFKSQSLKYLAMVSSSLISMSCCLKSSSCIHSGIGAFSLRDIRYANNESLGISGCANARESLKALAFCLRSTVFIPALALRFASVRMALFIPLDRVILSFLLLRVSIGTLGCPFFGSSMKLLFVSLRLRLVDSASLMLSLLALNLPLRGLILPV